MARKMLIQVRRDTAANWTSANPTLAAGEVGFETNTGKFKIGDGSTNWAGLTYFIPGVGAGGSSVATDTLWDAAGDLAVGTGADTAAKLAIGAAGKVPISNGTTLAYGFPPGYEFDYQEVTSSVTVTATSDATATTVVSGNAVTYDGSTIVLVEFFAFLANIDTDNQMIFNLYDGATDLGRIGGVSGQASGSTTASITSSVYLARRLTPSAAAHTFHIKAWKTGGTASVSAGAGGTATAFPLFIRVTKV